MGRPSRRPPKTYKTNKEQLKKQKGVSKPIEYKATYYYYIGKKDMCRGNKKCERSPSDNVYIMIHFKFLICKSEDCCLPGTSFSIRQMGGYSRTVPLSTSLSQWPQAVCTLTGATGRLSLDRETPPHVSAKRE